jgi:hypothetical protein
LPKLREIGFRANRRLLEVEHLSHDCILAEETFQRINGPVERAGQRASSAGRSQKTDEGAPPRGRGRRA